MQRTHVAVISRDADSLTDRVSKISEGSRSRADIHINVDKTKSMHVERQAKIAPPSFEKVVMATEVNYKNVCEFCGRHFKTARGMKIHKASYNHFHNLADEEDEIKLIKQYNI